MEKSTKYKTNKQAKRRPTIRTIKPAIKTGKLSPNTVKRIVKTVVQPRKTSR